MRTPWARCALGKAELLPARHRGLHATCRTSIASVLYAVVTQVAKQPSDCHTEAVELHLHCSGSKEDHEAGVWVLQDVNDDIEALQKVIFERQGVKGDWGIKCLAAVNTTFQTDADFLNRFYSFVSKCVHILQQLEPWDGSDASLCQVLASPLGVSIGLHPGDNLQRKPFLVSGGQCAVPAVLKPAPTTECSCAGKSMRWTRRRCQLRNFSGNKLSKASCQSRFAQEFGAIYASMRHPASAASKLAPVFSTIGAG